MAEYSKTQFEQGTGLPHNIVVIGGGTGSSTVVRAFTASPFSGEGVTAIATTFDDGGGAGELRKAYPGLPAVGDLRQCFDAMSGLSPGALEALKSRFGNGDESSRLKVEGQTIGNLIIARTMQSELEARRTIGSALEIVGEIFKVKGKVVPPSDDIRKLVFTLPDPTVPRIYGEHAAEESTIERFMGATISFIDEAGTEAPARISESAKEAIETAEMVILAPGDLYTSVGPNLAVDGMKEALENSPALIMMLSNLMNRSRHTVGYTTADYVEEYTRIIDANIIQQVIYNSAPLDPSALEQQAALGSHPVQPDVERLTSEGYAVFGFDLLSNEVVALDPHDALAATRSQIRHDPAKVAAAGLRAYLSYRSTNVT